MSIYKNTITLKGFLGANAVEHTSSNQKPNGDGCAEKTSRALFRVPGIVSHAWRDHVQR